MAEIDVAECLERCLEGIRRVKKFKRQCNVFQRCHCGNQMERLKHDADGARAQLRQLIFAHAGEVLSGDLDTATGNSLKPSRNHQQGRFARAAWADNCHSFALINRQIHAPQNIDVARPAWQGHTNVFKADGRCLGFVAQGLQCPV